MTTQTYMKSLGFCSATFFALWLLVIFLTSPTELGFVAFLLFYSLFFLATTGFCSLAFMFLGNIAKKHESVQSGLGTSVRQGALIGVLLTAVLLLQQFNIFAWWVGLLVLGGVFLVELYFLSRVKE